MTDNLKKIRTERTVKYARDSVWDIIYDMNHEDAFNKIKAEFEGVKYWEQEVQDIVDTIESVAFGIEQKMAYDWQNRQEMRKGEG